MLLAMIDTMVFDRLADDPSVSEPVLAAVAARRLVLCSTHVQEDQLAAVPDGGRRRVLQRPPRTVVPTAVRVLGVERTGRVRLDEAGRQAVERLGRHAPDSLITDAAKAHCDLLVTEDRRMAEEAGQSGITVWNVERLAVWAREAKADAAGA